ncbi:hypothetical protein C4J97_3028 [Pseudomonas orientalis]|nr:hypothetical protein C4J97_3028 [Pseudomonas orientalis]
MLNYKVIYWVLRHLLQVLSQSGDKHCSNVGGGLPPMAVYQVYMLNLTHCYRGQAPSHIGLSLY